MASDYFGALGPNRTRTRKVTKWYEIDHEHVRKMWPFANMISKEPVTYPVYVKEIKETRLRLIQNFNRIHLQVRAKLLESSRRREMMAAGGGDDEGGDGDTTELLGYSDQETLNVSQASSGYGSQEVPGTLRMFEE